MAATASGAKTAPSAKYTPGALVFGLVNEEERRWYAANVKRFDAASGKYKLVWCEDKSPVVLEEKEIRRAEDVLLPGVEIHAILPDRADFYVDVVLKKFGENDKHVCETIDDHEMLKLSASVMMVKDSSILDLKKKLAKAAKSASIEKDAKTSVKKRSLEDVPPAVDSGKKKLKTAFEPELDAVKEVSPKLLKNYSFILTRAAKGPDPRDRTAIQNKITEAGGKVHESFSEFLEVSEQRYLLAPECLRTVKYIQCLAANIPCVSEKWITDIAKKQQVTNFRRFLLPAGLSRPESEYVKWEPRKFFLKDTCVALYGISWFTEVYETALKAAKAVTKVFPLGSAPIDVAASGGSVVIVDERCPENLEELWKSCEARQIPLVGSEWLIQCIIQGKTVDYEFYLIDNPCLVQKSS